MYIRANGNMHGPRYSEGRLFQIPLRYIEIIRCNSNGEDWPKRHSCHEQAGRNPDEGTRRGGSSFGVPPSPAHDIQSKTSRLLQVNR
jgi:hypothetical protein